MDRCRWRKQIGMIDDHNECEWYRLTRVVPDKFHRAIKRLCVCVCVCVFSLLSQISSCCHIHVHYCAIKKNE